jgi:antitoxin component YwqK of YwqJK toxin-antitoxin module
LVVLVELNKRLRNEIYYWYENRQKRSEQNYKSGEKAGPYSEWDEKQELLDILETNGFETVAELSVTPLYELIAIDGIEEDSGKDILEKIKQQLGNAGSV